MAATPGFNHYMNQPSYGQKFYNAVPEIGTRNMFGTSAQATPINQPHGVQYDNAPPHFTFNSSGTNFSTLQPLRQKPERKKSKRKAGRPNSAKPKPRGLGLVGYRMPRNNRVVRRDLSKKNTKGYRMP